MKIRLALVMILAGLASAAHAQLFSEGFTRGSYPQGLTAPWATNSGMPGGWSVATNVAGGGGILRGGTNGAFTYGIAYVGTNAWTNYSVSAKVQFSNADAYGGGIGGRLNVGSGSRYAAWVYPEGSGGGGGVVRLFKFHTWGGFDFATADLPVPGVGTTNHTLRLDFVGSQVGVYFDSVLLTNYTHEVARFGALTNVSGGISVDMFTDGVPYSMLVDDVLVSAITTTPVANNDGTYNPVTGKLFTLASPGVLANDTGGVGPLRAIVASYPARGNLSFNTNGGFTYTATNGYTGADSFTYRASDNVSTSGVATVNLTVVANTAPVASADSFTVAANQTSTISAPGVLANDTDVNGDALTAVIGATTTNGVLSLNANGGFTYTPTGSYTGPDAFTYRANDGSANSSLVLVSLSVLTPGVLFTDNFTRGTDPAALTSPWATNTGEWRVTGGALRGGTNAASNYGIAYNANTWANYSVQARVRFSNSNCWGGGIGGRLTDASPSGGGRYGAWIYPDASAGGSNVLVLIKFTGWTAFSPPAAYLATVPLGGVGTNYHTVKLAFAGDRIGIYYDGVAKTVVQDTTSSPFLSGGITAEMWTDATPNSMTVDDVAVNSLVVEDFYSGTSGVALTRAGAAGVLTNDAGLSTNGLGLTATLVSGPVRGSLTLSNNGGFSYTATNGYVGVDSFTYQASDGGIALGTATVNLTVGPSGPESLFFVEFFDGVTAPALPSGWTSSSGGVTANPWVTTNTSPHTFPNAAFCADSATMGSNALTSPVIALPGGLSRLVFDHSYNLEDDANGVSFDGGILEIKIASGAFTDILVAGGSFVTNGYDRVISSGFNNPFKGQPAWGGDSDGYVETVVNLPPAAAGTNIQLRWRCGTDSGNGVPVEGWRVDTVRITNCLTAVCWNTPPILPAQTNRTIVELAALSVTNSASQADVPTNSLTYSLLVAPSGATINSSGVISWTPSEAQGPSANTFTTRVVDNGSPPLSATNSFIVTVTETNNNSPVFVLPNLTNFTIVELTTFTRTNNATDADVPPNVLTYSLLTFPTGATINTNTGVITWTPSEAQGPSISNVFQTRVVDNGSPALNATNTFYVSVTETNNNSPVFVLPNLTNFTIVELTTFTRTNNATDADVPPNVLTYSLLTFPTGATINTNTGVITWTPSEAQGPSISNVFQTRVVDNGSPALNATNTFYVSVTETNNNSPVFVLPNLTNYTVAELSTLTVTNSATDADVPPNVLTYSLLTFPTGATINTNTGVITWTPTEAQGPSSSNIFQTRVEDNASPERNITNILYVTVTEINVAPNATSFSVTTPEDTVTNLVLQGGDTDLPANTLTYAILTGPTNGSLGTLNTTNGAVTYTPTSSYTGADAIQFTVSDGSLSATGLVSITVSPANVAPVLPSQTNLTIVTLSTMTVTNTATDVDLPADTLGYSLLVAPTNAAIDANGVITWTPTVGQGGSTNTFTTVVTDNGTPPLSATNTFIVTVTESVPMDQPIIQSIAVTNDIATVTWSAVVAHSYRLQSVTNIGSTNWADVGAEIIASGATASQTNSVVGEPEQFYRVRMAP